VRGPALPDPSQSDPASAASQYVGGSNWYSQVKATQKLAKDTFDAIDIQLAFSP
jgi:hypothetical protein